MISSFRVASGSADGQVRLWDLSSQKVAQIFQGHDKKFIRGIIFTPDGQHLLSIGDDKNICTWKTQDSDQISDVDLIVTDPEDVIASKAMLTGITYHRSEAKFATCGDMTQLWDAHSNHPIKEFQWGVDTVHEIKFNQVEPHILGACASDRSIILYDIRLATPMRKVIMELTTNAIAWNPMEAPTFIAANEDYNLYAFDMRHLKRPTNVHMDHVSAVTCVAFAPTGREFVSGSYDKTVRIFPVEKVRQFRPKAELKFVNLPDFCQHSFDKKSYFAHFENCFRRKLFT